jgi:hypothetical protein
MHRISVNSGEVVASQKNEQSSNIEYDEGHNSTDTDTGKSID